MSLSTSQPLASAPARCWWQSLLRLAAFGLIAVWSVLLLAWLTLHWGILPHIDEWRPRIEALATRSVGAPVRIGRIQAQPGGWLPAMELLDVQLHDAQGRTALRLPRVAAALSPQSLLALQLRFEQLLIENAELDVRRDEQGRISVAGLDMGGDAASGTNTDAADWFFQQHEFIIRGGTLRWVDDLRRAPPLALSGVQLVIRNGLKRHDLSLDATLPAGWGERLSLRARMSQPLLARAADFGQWSGSVQAELPHAEVAQLRRYLDLPLEVAQGSGALRLGLDLERGQARKGVAEVALRDVTLRLAPTLAPLRFTQLQGRFEAEQSPEQWRVVASPFGFVTGDGRQWPTGRLALTLRRAAGAPGATAAGAGVQGQAGPLVGGEFSADRLDLPVLASLAERLPLGDGVRKLLAGMAPQGAIQDLSLRWDGPLDAPRQYQARARLKGVSIAAAPSPESRGIGRPGVRQADIDLQASETGGSARLSVAGGALEFPGVFEQPVVPITRLDTQLLWHITPGAAGTPPQVALQLKDARFENEEFKGEVSGGWRTGHAAGFGKGARLPGVLDLSGRLARGQATAVARYLPLGIPQEARHYVARAVQAGRLEAGSFKVKGDLWDFPFYKSKDGEFQVAGQVRDGQLAYVPDSPADPDTQEAAWVSPWPVFTQVQGELVFDRLSMTIRNAQGRLWGTEVVNVNGGIADFAAAAPLLLEGRTRGPAGDLLRYVNATPVGGWIGDALAQASVGGHAEMSVTLSLPLAHLAASTVKGSVQLQGGDVRVQPGTPLLAGARGRVDFSHKGFAVVGGSARVAGGEATFDGGSQPDGSLRFSGQGTATAEALRRMTELGPVARAAQLMSGSAPYRMQLGFVKGHQEINVSSPLTGMAIDLPAPLGKAADAPGLLRLSTTMLPESLAAGASPRDVLKLELGSEFQAQYQRDVSGAEAQVLRGAVAVNASLPPLAPGVQAAAEFDSLNADVWQAALQQFQKTAPPAAAGGAALPFDGGYLPRDIRLQAQELVAGQRRLSKLNLHLTHLQENDDSTWRAQIQAEQSAGLVEYREPRRGGGVGRVYARLARLSLPPADAAQVETLLDQAPASVPALDVVIDDFELRGKKLGRVELEAVNRGVAGVDAPREWRLSKLKISTPEAQLSGSGVWTSPPGSPRRRMALDFRLDLADSGAFLERLGFGRVVKGGKGRLQGQVAWVGSPLALDLPTLDGQMALSLDAGQFLKADAGAARLLGVLSLQSLPRRLALDFRDVFQEGFAFDNVGGDIQLSRGKAHTNNLRMRGLQAAVLMEGSADIARETQDLRVLVVPDLNAGTASLAYATINPAVGLGTFLAQWLLRRPLQAVGTREFHISGSWDDPQVQRVQRKPGEAAPDIDDLPATSPAAAASSPPNNP